MRRRIAASLVALLVLPVSSATAFHDDWESMPLVWQDTVSGPSWIALQLTVGPGDSDRVDVVFQHDQISSGGEWFFDSDHLTDQDGDTFGGFGASGCGSLAPRVYARVGDEPPLIDHRPERDPCLIGTGVGYGVPRGTYTWVHMVGGDGPIAARVTIRVAPNVTVNGITTGDAFDAADEDFAGTLNAHARTIAAEAQAIVDGSVAQRVDRSLYGWFLAHGPALMHTERGDGWRSDGWGVFFGEGPGDYRFVIDAKAAAEVIFWTRAWLLAADVTLP